MIICGVKWKIVYSENGINKEEKSSFYLCKTNTKVKIDERINYDVKKKVLLSLFI